MGNDKIPDELRRELGSGIADYLRDFWIRP